MAVQIQIRRGTSSNWTSANPVLAQGELGIELDTRKFKVGDGLTAWNSLLYVAARPEDLTSEISAAVAQILGDAPAVLDTLGELSDAINDDPNFVSTVTTLSGDFTSHTSATTTVHGIADTSALETQTGAQAKADAAQSASNTYTDTEISTATTSLQAYTDTAEADAVEAAAADATSKANAAQAAAEATAAADATAKANAAETAANTYTDNEVSSAEARMEVYSAPALQFAADGSVLRNLPAQVPSAERLLKQAVWWIDSAHSSADGQAVQNLGWGGTALNAQLGSAGSADSNDPLFLDWSGENYVYLPGGGSNYLSVPDEAALDITGDIDIRAQVAMDDWTPAANTQLVSKYGHNPNRSYALVITSTGLVRLGWSNNGTTELGSNSTVATGITDGSVKWVRATLDVDNGASGHDVTFYLSDDGVNWSQLGSTVTTAGTASIHSGSEGVYLGSSTANTNQLAGNIYRAQVFDGIDGTKVLDVDCSQITSGSNTSFTALTGQTVSIVRPNNNRSRVAEAVTSPVWVLGSDDYFRLPDSDLLDVGTTDAFTVVVAVRSWVTQWATMRLISKDADTGAGWNMSFAIGKSWFTLRDAANTVTPEVLGLTDGTLCLMAGVRNPATDTVSHYRNGTVVSLADTTTDTSANALDMNLGRRPSGPTDYATAAVYAAAIFRRALTSGEITTLTNYFQGRIA